MMDNIDICKCSECSLQFTAECIKSEAFIKKTFNQLRFSIYVIKDHIIQSHRLYIGSEDDADEKFMELLIDAWKKDISTKNNYPPLDDQCWKKICELGHFEINGTHFYISKLEEKHECTNVGKKIDG